MPGTWYRVRGPNGISDSCARWVMGEVSLGKLPGFMFRGWRPGFRVYRWVLVFRAYALRD
jgi:hypothetical protein